MIVGFIQVNTKRIDVKSQLSLQRLPLMPMFDLQPL